MLLSCWCFIDMCGMAKGGMPRWQFRYDVSHPSPYLQSFMSLTSSGETYTRPRSSVSSQGRRACASTASVPFFVWPSVRSRSWNSGSIISILGTLSEQAARSLCSSTGVYFFVAADSDGGLRAATVSKASLKHFWGSKVMPGAARPVAGMSLRYRVRLCIHAIMRRSTGGLCHLAFSIESASFPLWVQAIASQDPRKSKPACSGGGVVSSNLLNTPRALHIDIGTKKYAAHAFGIKHRFCTDISSSLISVVGFGIVSALP
jgi:hypothetical protein